MRNSCLLLIFIVFIFLTGGNCCFGDSLSGVIQKEKYVEQDKTGAVIDILTGKPVANATVSLPSQGISSQTDENGQFCFDSDLKGPAILSVKAGGYKPFSLTVNKDKLSKALILGISKESGNELVIDSGIHHLGDNNFSSDSANAGDFRSQASGSYFSKKFYVKSFAKNRDIILKIGSVIGVDTAIARKLGQNSIINSFSSPTIIYLNSKKVGEIKINGDNQEIIIAGQFLIPDNYNQITVETGRNLLSTRYVDYDDMEFMNLILEFK